MDAGAAKVGIARGSTGARLAEPLLSVETKEAAETLASIAEENQAAGIVIGLPRGLDGQETAQTQAVKNWVVGIKEKIKLPLYWQDEAATSLAAGELQTSNFKHQASDEHAVAAAIILQDFLDTPKQSRVVV